MNFITCYPDANSFKEIIKIKTLDDWSVEYVPLTKTTGYWISDTPFYNDGFNKYKELLSYFPITKNNNDQYSRDPNPFRTIHVPNWVSEPICLLIKDFYLTYINPYYNNGQFNEWGNLHQNDSRPIDCFRIPHIDYLQGIVGNLWLTNHDTATTGTNLYEYSGKIHGLFYDFQIDTSHKLYKEFKDKPLSHRLEQWKNFDLEEAEYWGFKLVGSAPSVEGKITMYKANVCHAPYINKVDITRWSHTFAFYHDEVTLGNTL